ncbi:MAG TPA: metal ABC transporter permease [candidate division Zixibacteria bacterium]|nr:metal ABC transporter permease [candidate division Zixibacteria bacterium]
MSPDFWVILTGILAASACGLIGTFLVLRQNAMLGDAISHAVLPGLALGFLITSSRGVVPMIVGAGLMGLLTAFLTEFLARTGRLYRDSSLGIVFTSLFSVGVILIAAFAGQVDLDQECVLYGEIAYTPWDTFIWGGANLGPRSVWILGTVLLINTFFIILFYKQLKITSFDPALAKTLGISDRLWHYLLTAIISLTVVASFESVGAILVVAMLIIPGATAFLLTQRLRLLLILSVIIGIASAVGGYFGASATNTSIAGFMAVVGGLIFTITITAKSLVDRKKRTTASNHLTLNQPAAEIN